jgi:hypothetical protein
MSSWAALLNLIDCSEAEVRFSKEEVSWKVRTMITTAMMDEPTMRHVLMVLSDMPISRVSLEIMRASTSPKHRLIIRHKL